MGFGWVVVGLGFGEEEVGFWRGGGWVLERRRLGSGEEEVGFWRGGGWVLERRRLGSGEEEVGIGSAVRGGGVFRALESCEGSQQSKGGCAAVMGRELLG